MDQTMDQWTDQQTIDGLTDGETLSYRGKEASEIKNAQKRTKLRWLQKNEKMQKKCQKEKKNARKKREITMIE